MLDKVEEFLRLVTPEEHIRVLRFSDEILDLYGIGNYDSMLLEILSEFENDFADASMTLIAVDGFYRDCILRILNEQKITLINENDLMLSEINDIAYAVKNAQSLESAEDIIDMLKTDDHDVELFCNLLEYTSANSKEWFSIRIGSVHPNTIPLLIDWYEKQAEVEASDDIVEPDREKLSLVRSYLKFLEVPDLNITKAIRQGLQLNLGFTTYIKVLVPYFPKLREENICAELLLCYIISSDSKDTSFLKVDKLLSTIGNDHVTIQRMQKKIRELNNDFTNFISREGSINEVVL